MSYDANRACDQCGNPSVWATTCEGCEMWAKGHRDGLKEGETDRDAWKANAAEWRERAENAEREIHERRGSDGRNLAAVVEAKSRATKVESQLQTIVDSFTFGCRSEKGGGQSALEIIARDRDEWKERANKFEATVEMLEARGEADLLNAEAAIARATQAEAQAAAMRLVLRDMCIGYPASAGRTLLAELEALRELEQRVRKRCDEAVPQWGTELREALAAVDAARKGER